MTAQGNKGKRHQGAWKEQAWSQKWEGTGRRAVCDSHQLIRHMYTLALSWFIIINGWRSHQTNSIDAQIIFILILLCCLITLMCVTWHLAHWLKLVGFVPKIVGCVRKSRNQWETLNFCCYYSDIALNSGFAVSLPPIHLRFFINNHFEWNLGEQGQALMKYGFLVGDNAIN